MKKINTVRLNKICLWALAFSLGGMNSCDIGGNLDETLDNVSPTVNYYINGTVVSETDSKVVIPDLQVVISFTAPHPCVDTLFTGNDGTFKWNTTVSSFGKDMTFTLQVTDKSERYAPYSTLVLFCKEELYNEIPLFVGEARKNILIKLKKNDTSSF
jgi:putative lipoprotein (rSAM/lipoprotein system)